jgi:hypothetical protein
MTAAELLGSLQQRGIVLAPAVDGRLRYRPRDALSVTDRADLARHRDAILALFEADPVGWRAAVMGAQAPRTGPIPLLLARPGIRFLPGSCCSCGEPRPADRYRCADCAAASVRALAAVQPVTSVAS